LENIGYEVQAFIIPASGINAPHQRERLWITAHSINGGYSTRRLLYQWYYGNYRHSQHRIWLYESNQIDVWTGENGYYMSDGDSTGSYTIPLDTWTHIALVKEYPSPTSAYSARTSLFINGVRRRRSNNYDDYGFDYLPYSRYDIGGDWGARANGIAGYQQNGYTGLMSNMRIVRNLAVYTGNFTVPTSPLGLTQSAGTNISAITGDNDTGRTIFLTCNDSTLRDNGYYDRTSSFVNRGGVTFVADSPF
jgi:hypothetical protein